MTQERIPPTPERIAKNDLEMIETKRGGSLIRSYSWPIDFYLKTTKINKKQHIAAEKLYTLYVELCGGPKYTQVAYRDSTGARAVPEMMFQRSVPYRDAIMSIQGQRGRDLIVDVVCLGYYAGRGKAMQVLNAALDDLVAHFKPKYRQ